MGLKLEDIKKLQNPYIELGDKLVENREELNKLDSDEMIDLASRMILECPAEELSLFKFSIEALRTPQDDKDTFHEALTKAWEVRKRLTSLVDPKNPKPHEYILGAEFNEELFNNYNNLALNVLKDKEVAIATRLALTTPEADHKSLARNIRNMFPASTFAENMAAALNLRHCIEAQLLGEQPEAFFASRDFNVDYCLEFSGLFVLLKGKEKEIGEKLALIESPKVLSDIARNLEQLDGAAHDQENPFRLISAAMNSNRQQQKQEPIIHPLAKSEEIQETSTKAKETSFVNSGQSLFASPELTKRKVKSDESATVTMNEESDSGDEDTSDEDNGICCGLFK